MLIRCDKCTTVYELDETVLPATGAPVQCSKCQFVFTAYRPSQARSVSQPPEPAASAAAPHPAPAAAPTQTTEATEMASVPLGDDEGVVSEPRPAAAGPRAPASVANGALADEPKFTADGRPIRKVAFPSEPPPTAPRPSAARPNAAPVPVAVRPGPPRPVWLVVAAAVVVIALALLAWRLLVHRGSSAGAAAEMVGARGLLAWNESSHSRPGVGS